MRLAVLLVWALADCQPDALIVWDGYIRGSGDMSHWGRPVSPTVTWWEVAPGKPEPGEMPCAIGWSVAAVDAAGQPLPPECQPSNFTADGQAWEGM